MAKVKVIIQCRTTSTRLPGKAFLPIKGMASIVLCAKRAMNKGAQVIVATSTDKSDDNLTTLLEAQHIPYVRGPLDDVLKRYVKASEELADEDYIIRLTADNVFPDGNFINEIMDYALSNHIDYCRTDYVENDLPYGLGCEIFTRELLIQADKLSTDAYEREHVTPWMRKQGKDNVYLYKNSHALASARCTLDTLADYLSLENVFKQIDDPIQVSWQKLCDALVNYHVQKTIKTSAKKTNMSISEFTLGTAQIGMDYGITNTNGLMQEHVAKSMIEKALDFDITTFDCARGYGLAEKRLGQQNLANVGTTIVTKLSPFFEQRQDKQSCENYVKASVYQSCFELRTHAIDILMLHRFWQLQDPYIWEEILNLKEKGVIKFVGLSVSSLEEAMAALAEKAIQYIQLPFNLLDWRWHDKAFQAKLSERSDVTIFARSIFLQGLLLAKPVQWPEKFKNIATDCEAAITKLSTTLGRKSAHDLCIAYARAQTWIDSLVIGCADVAQLEENVTLFKEPKLTQDECKLVRETLPVCPETLLNPALW
ncbi:MAG: aldo/keto reductase [Proteobacteria bacterium]|nr:aldo/keto reductase [Pseudomonadota bacterium]